MSHNHQLEDFSKDQRPRPRDEKGRFLASEYSKGKRCIGLRLPKQSFQRFQEISRSLGVLPAALARGIVTKWIAEFDDDVDIHQKESK